MERPVSVETSLLNIVSRLGERVAKAEMGLEAVKNDTEHLRVQGHEVANSLQKIFLMEQTCAQSLTTLSAQVTKLVDQAPVVSIAVAEFSGMRQDIKGLIEMRQRWQDNQNWRTALAVWLRTILPWIAAIAGMSLWAWTNLRYVPHNPAP